MTDDAPADDRFVYVFCDFFERFMKIGVSSDVLGRYDDLQTAHPLPLLPVAVGTGGLAMERMLKAEFAPSRLKGEWFVFTDANKQRIANLWPEADAIYAPQRATMRARAIKRFGDTAALS